MKVYIYTTHGIYYLFIQIWKDRWDRVSFVVVFLVWSKNMEISWIRSWQQVAVLVQDKSLSQKDEGVCLYETETDWKGDY